LLEFEIGIEEREKRSLEAVMKLKIAMLSVHSCPLGKLGGESTGGMSVYIRELSRELGKLGHSIDVFTRAHGRAHDRVVELGKNVRLIHLTGGEEKEIPKLTIYSHLSEFVRGVDHFRKTNGFDYDLIHSHYWLSGWAGTHLQQLWKVPHMTMLHSMGAVKNTTAVGKDEPDLRIRCESLLVRSCQRIIAPTEREKEYLVHYYGASPEAIRVTPCGVNLDLFRSIEKKFARNYLGFNGDEIILFVGRIVPIKGIDKLLMAMTYLEKREKIKLVVIGGDQHCEEEVKRLKALTRRLEIDDSVDFLGLVDQEELPYFYSAADLCVFPSYYESFGLVALESLACGTPVVATRVGGIEGVIREGETGYVVKDNAPDRLAEKIALMLSVSKAKEAAIHSIRASVIQYSWAKIAEAMVPEYEALLSSRRARNGGQRSF
jgi:D-inositol-3-phosphate glycosyltransferase